MRSPFLDRLERGVLLGDGAMGSQLYARGVPYERCFDELNLTDPALIQRIHREYIRAGAELIETNTYGANRFKLAQYGLEDRVRDINFRAVKLAREAREECGEPVFLAGAIGPLGQTIAPVGTITVDEARGAFTEQADALLEAGADLIVLETFGDLQELREAIVAVQSTCDLPIVAQVSLTDDGSLLTGENPADVARLLASFQVDVIGVNCGVGPQSTLDAVRQMALPLFAQTSAMPNAGAPSRLEGRYLYFSTPEYFAEYARRFVDAGVRLIGGCCGTTPAHVAAMKQALAEHAADAPRIFPSSGQAALLAAPAPTPPGEAIESAVSVEPTQLQKALAERKFVVSVELDPPK